MISAMTFTNITKQNGIRNVETFYRECMVGVVFHYERLEEIKNNIAI